METFRFKGIRGMSSICGLDTFRHEGKTCVVATELRGNIGTSVTNAWPSLADEVCERLFLDPKSVIWVEHYTKSPAGWGVHREASWDVVHMDWDGKNHHMSKSVHPWSRVSSSMPELQLALWALNPEQQGE